MNPRAQQGGRRQPFDRSFRRRSFPKMDIVLRVGDYFAIAIAGIIIVAGIATIIRNKKDRQGVTG